MRHRLLSLKWKRPRRAGSGKKSDGPLPLPDRGRIRRVAAIYHAQLKKAERSGVGTDTIVRLQADALREFSLELAPEVRDEFMNIFTEESSALERQWQVRHRAWKPHYELPPMLVTTLVFFVTICAIVLAIRYAV
ncbi:MAG: hypothetical protein JWL95_2170 [Gemmatimonadetes bacterium]|nr:hypothetical protein [Gemmatimonadota bacterium]